MHDALPTKDKLKKWGVINEKGLCNQGEESQHHLLYKCNFTIPVLEVFYKEVVGGDSWDQKNRHMKFKGGDMNIYKIICLWLYSVWKFRNEIESKGNRQTQIEMIADINNNRIKHNKHLP